MMVNIMTPLEEFDAMLPSGTDESPYPVFSRLRSEAPVFFNSKIDGWVVSRWADVTRVFENSDEFVPMEAGSGSSGIYGRTILHMTGDEHRRKVAILARRLRSPKRLSGDLRVMVESVTRDHGDRLPRDLAGADVKGGFTSAVPLDVIAELMAMQGATAFVDWYHRIVAASVSNVTGDQNVHASGVAARDELFAWLTPEIVSKRSDATDDLLSDLSTGEFEGARLSDDEVRSFCAFLLSAGIETTDRALVNLCRELVASPDHWYRLKQDPGLIPSAIAEILRLRPPVQASVRKAVHDVELSGTVIPKGDKVMVLLGSANHDESVFEDPEVFDLDRFGDKTGAQFTPAGPQRGFGGGAHTCTGSLLAKLEMEVAMEYLLERFDRMEFAGEPPAEEGFVLRSAPRLDLILHPE